MKKLYSFITALLLLPAAAGAQTSAEGYSLSIDSFEPIPGETVPLVVNLNNVGDITALQFDLYLPEGLKVAEDEYGPFITISSRASRTHQVSNGYQSDGALRIMMVSFTNANINGNEGALLTFDVEVAADFPSGDYTIDMNKIIMVTAKAVEYKPADYSFAFSYDDGSGDVTDPAEGYSLSIDSFEPIPGETVPLVVNLNNVGDITALQLDLYLPEGLKVAEDEYGPFITISNRASRTHQISHLYKPDGALRIVMVSMTNANINGNEGALLTFDVEVAESFPSGDYTIDMKKIVMATVQGVEYRPADYSYAFNFTGGESGIGNIETDSPDSGTEWFDLKGVRVENPQNGVFIKVKDGKAVKVAK